MLRKILKVKNILMSVLIGWIGFSIFYIGRDQLFKMKFSQLQTGYQAGVADSVRALLQQADSCQPISVFEGDKEVKLIKIDCVQKLKDNEFQTAPTGTTNKEEKR